MTDRIACVGEALVDMLAQTGVSDIGASETFRRVAGGAVANVAVGIARLGGSASFVGAIGADPFGDHLVRVLEAQRVDVGGVRRVAEATGIIFVGRGADGAREFFPVDGSPAHYALTPDDVDRADIRSARAVLAGGYMLARDPGRAACLHAMASAGPHALVCFDQNVRPRGFADADAMRAAILDAGRLAHLVKASSEDLALLGLDPADPSPLLRGKTIAAVVTHGARGAAVATIDGARADVDAPRVDVVDTTGAGDAFVAALLWHVIARGKGDLGIAGLADASRFAAAAGALACTAEGAIASLPTAAQVRALADERSGRATHGTCSPPP